jgi:hypothetical protein
MTRKINKSCPFIDSRSEVLCKGFSAENHSVLCAFRNRHQDCDNETVWKIWKDLSEGIVRPRPDAPLGEHWKPKDSPGESDWDYLAARRKSIS